ncbi:MAG: class I SAM-dependent methyltransferase [Hyphomonadaceae bacterium]|nr:class I SAM-dependent methyltransferase [Hyphomonadaceae bacterium]
MNLFDLVNRKDRSIQWLEGAGEARALKWQGGTQRGVQFEKGARLRIANAHEFTALRVRPQSPNWRWASVNLQAPLVISIEAPRGVKAELAAIQAGIGDAPKQIVFHWPVERDFADAFDIEISASEGGALAVGPQISMRASVLRLARGVGLEVGPGISPSVLPADDVDVSYVESCPLEEWSAKYTKGRTDVTVPSELASRYVVGSAVSLDEFPEGQLDFVFSNHVFEHLANPLRVLRNWLRVLKPGGVIAGVTPDPRYTFDCRQPVTTLSEALAEAESPGHDIPLAKYERWTRWTAPEVSPASLIQRDYSIHVNFFTPETFADVADFLKHQGLISGSTIVAAPNQKDFAFALWKS